MSEPISNKFTASFSWTDVIHRPVADMVELLRFPSQANSTENSKIVWLVRLRWMAILLFFMLTVPALITGHLTKQSVSIYLGTLSILILFNLFTQLRYAKSEAKTNSLILCFQLAFDLIVLTGLLMVARGYNSPLVALFLLNVSLGGILIPGRFSLPFIFLAHTLLGLLQFQLVIANKGAADPLLIGSFAVYHILLFGFWLVMRLLGAYLERQNQRTSLAQVALEKQDRLRSIGALAAGFSHEFASPLNVAKIRLERLVRTNPTTDATEALKAIQSCENILHQMNSSQLDARDHQHRDLNLVELLKDVLDSWSEDKPNLKLETAFPAGLITRIPPLNFSQAVINLLDNAFEAAPDGLIRVTLSENQKAVFLSVSDQGPGLPASVLKQRGEPFVTTKPEGTGLGLYVTELFVLSLGGQLEIHNPKSGGAMLSLVWPLQETQT